MPPTFTPLQIVKALLQGTLPPRPLFLPIVFSLGAKVENVSLESFLQNPTKISQSLRQLRAHFRSDGVSCYFDPRLAAGLRSPEDAAKSPRVKAAVEVIRRLKSLVNDGSLLMASVSGPAALAAEIAQGRVTPELHYEDLPEAALETAAATVTHIVTAFLEAGANAVFIREETLPRFTAESFEAWRAALSSAFNIARFYEALPVLQLTDPESFARNFECISQAHWDCVICPVLLSAVPEKLLALSATTRGISLPVELFTGPGDEAMDEYVRSIQQSQPVVVTTADDLPWSVENKRLLRFQEAVSSMQRGEEQLFDPSRGQVA
jgi:hypothetical protein